MKIRTDFVTNSSSSGFVVISVTMRDGTEYEIEREYDTGYGGYFWANVSKSMDDALPELKNGLELLDLLRGNIEDFEEFILFKDKQGIAFKENVSAINDFNDVRSIIIAEQTRFDDGGSDSCRLEFSNKTAINKATVTRSKYEYTNPTANSYRCVGIKSKKLAELLLGMTDYIQEATGEKTILTDEDKYEMIIDEDIISLVAPYDMPEYHWRKQLDYEFASSAADVAGVLSPVLFFHSSTDRSNFWSFLEEAIVQAVEYIQTHGDAKYSLYTGRLFHSDSRIYSLLFRKKAEYERWYDIHARYFDQPEVLPKGKVIYSVYAQKDVAINLSTYGWKQQKTFTNSVEYLVVDTTVIPNFDRFLYKIDAVDRGDLQKAKNFGSNMLEKAIELKKSNQPIKIITKAYLDMEIIEECLGASFVRYGKWHIVW